MVSANLWLFSDPKDAHAELRLEVGFFYAGLLRRKNALSCIALSLAVYAVVSIQWFLFGYSLTFSPTASKFIGNFKHFGFIGVLEKPIESIPNATVPPLIFAVYQWVKRFLPHRISDLLQLSDRCLQL